MASNSNSIDIVINATTSGFTSNMSKLTSSVNSSISGLEKLSKTVVGLGLAYAGVTGFKSLAEGIMKTRMEYEKMEAALSATVGAENMEAVFKSLQQFAKDTPFTLEQTTTAYQRLVNLGLNPTKEAMLAYGNIAAGIPNKSIIDFVEAVADAVTGENERLKEFGIKASKSGDMVSYTFQGVTETFKATAENIENYLIKTGAAFANGQALSNQAATMSGRLNALGDTFSQLQNNIAKSSGAATLFGSAIETVTDFVQYLNDLFESDAITSYIDAFKTSFQPIVNLFNTLKALAQDTPFAQFFKSGTDSLTDFWNQLSGLYTQFMELIEFVNQLVSNGSFSEIWNLAVEALKPYYDMLLEFADWLYTGFLKVWDDLVDSILSVWDMLPAGIKKPLEDAYNYFKDLFSAEDGALNGQNLLNKIKANFIYFPIYIVKAINDALAHFKRFRDVALAYVNSVIVAVKEFSVSAGGDFLEKSIGDADKKLAESLDKNAKNYDASAAKIVAAQQKVNDKVKEAKRNADAANKATAASIAASKKEADQKMKALKDEQTANKGKDIAGDIGKNIVAKQKENAKNSPAADTGKKKSGGSSSSSSKVNEEYKKMLDGQIKMEEDRYKQGEVSAKEHFDKLLQLKLAQIGAEKNAGDKAYQENLKIINDANSTEAQKNKAIKANQELQNKMNGSTQEEKNIREEIANQLRDANKEYLNNINSIQQAINNLKFGGNTIDDTMKEFESKYADMRKRIAAEDAANGTNDSAKLQELESLTKATAQIAEEQRKLNLLEAEYEATLAELETQREAGDISYLEYQRQKIDLTKELTAERVKYANTELDIANKTEGFNKESTANIRKRLAEYKTAQIQANDFFSNMASGFSDAVGSAFSDIISNAKSATDIVKGFANNLAQSLINVLTKGYAEQLASMFSNLGSGSASGGGGFLASIGSAIGGLFGGSRAVGGPMKPNTFYKVNENGPEYFYNGAKPTSVMTAANTQKMMSKQSTGNTVIQMNITTKDANSFRYSQSQMMTKMQQERIRQVNRNS